MFTLYNADETKFLDNGLLEIDDIITDCKVEFGINKPFICNLTIFKDNLEKYKMVEGEKIILLPTPTGRQPFRIVDILPVDDFELNVFCRHIFHDLSKRTVNRCKVDSGNGAFILNKYKTSLDKAVPHTFTSNIANQTSLDWVRKKGLECLLGDDENSFLNRLGGELEVNGFNVAINTRIGTDRGFIAMYRKNITGFNGKISLDGLITRIMPVGFDGITLNELYVDSDLINKYNDIYSEIIDFSEVKWKGSPNNHSEEGFDTLEQAQEELKRLARQYYLDTKCDVVQANFEVNIALLQDTEEYKDTAILEQLFLGDDIEIDFEPFNIKMNKRMVYYTYDSLLQQYESIQIGEGEDNFLNDINNKIDKLPSLEDISSGLQNAIDQAFKNVTDAITGGGNNSYIKFIPNIINPREIIACDNEILENAVYCVRFNKNGIGVSTTGFNGPYQGLVTEGKLVINEITCNEFTAALIKTGILSDATGKTWINMDNGTFNFADKIKFIDNKFSISLNSGEDLENTITTTTKDIKTSLEKAAAAQTTATNANTAATNANNKLSDIASDSKLTESEKKITKKEWDVIVSEKSKIEAEAVKFGVITTAFTTQYNTLNTYITPLLSNLNITSNIVGATFRSNFTNYYNARQDLLNAITTKAKALADAAKTQADKGVADALIANEKAGQTLIDAKNYTNTEITTVTNKVSSANSEITQLKEKIELKVEKEDITTAITNISIGGRNLFLNAELLNNRGWDIFDGTIVNGYLNNKAFYRKNAETSGHRDILAQNLITNSIIRLKENTWYTFSFYIKGSGQVRTHIYPSVINTNIKGQVDGLETLLDSDGYKNWNLTSDWELHTYTFKTVTSFLYTPRIFFRLTFGNEVFICMPKVEQGNKATDFTVAPEDIGQSIADTITINETKINAAKSEIKLETDKINLSVSAVDEKVTTTNGDITAVDKRLQAAEVKITSSAIINSVSSTINDGSGAINTTNTVLNKQGLTINNGALIVKNTNGSTVIDGSKYIQYVEMYGNGAIVIQNGEVDAILTLRHGKGYVPDFKGEWMDKSARVYSDPLTIYAYGANNGYHGIELTGKMWIDDTYLYVWIRRIPSQANSGTITHYYRYFILGGITY